MEMIDLLPTELRNRIEVIPECGCWTYTGDLNRNGYGWERYKGNRRMIHRIVYALLGFVCPPKYVLDHRCRVRCCCNPHHLEPVTPRENTLRGIAKLFRKENCHATLHNSVQ
jgi:hypothetical protein